MKLEFLCKIKFCNLTTLQRQLTERKFYIASTAYCQFGSCKNLHLAMLENKMSDTCFMGHSSKVDYFPLLGQVTKNRYGCNFY